MQYPETFRFTNDHEWIDVQGASGRVGITDYAQKQLGDVVFMELPSVGQTLKAGQTFGSIESVKAVSELFAPVSGEVIEVNESLKTAPELINKDPHGQWMIAIRLSQPSEVAALLDAAQYASLVK